MMFVWKFVLLAVLCQQISCDHGTVVDKPADDPSVEQQSETELAFDEPGASEPGSGDLGVEQQSETELAVDEPGASEPGSGDPSVEQQSETEVVFAEPGASEPGSGDPSEQQSETELAVDEPGASEPGSGDPSVEQQSETEVAFGEDVKSESSSNDTDDQSSGDVGVLARSAAVNSKENFVMPKNTAAIVGESVELMCRGRTTNIHWTFLAHGSNTGAVIVKDHCAVDARHIDDYDVDTTGNSCNLKIDSVTLELAGTYACLDRGVRSTAWSAVLIVLDSTPVCNSSAEEGKILSYGAQVRFTCFVHFAGYAAPTMKWTDEFGKDVTCTATSSGTYLETGFTMRATSDTVRRYTCTTYFNEINVPPNRGTLKANNAPHNTYSWTSTAVKVAKRMGRSNDIW